MGVLSGVKLWAKETEVINKVDKCSASVSAVAKEKKNIICIRRARACRGPREIRVDKYTYTGVPRRIKCIDLLLYY